jgi:hypothetical protein
MTALVIVEGLALLLLTVLVAGLLRSHAEILRKLHDLGASMDPDSGAASGAHEGHGDAHRDAHESHDLGFPVPPGRALPSAKGARPAADISGETAASELAHIAVTGVERDTVIAFLSTGCRTCAGLWSSVGDGSRLGFPADTNLVIVTRSADEESLGRIRELAPQGVPVLLSTEAWDAYEVPVAPYFVHVDGTRGKVIGEGAASSWKQVADLLRDATSDRKATLSRRQLFTRPTGSRLLTGGSDPAPETGADGLIDVTDSSPFARREQRIDAELRAAGIEPGDPSLYLDRNSLYGSASEDDPAHPAEPARDLR